MPIPSPVVTRRTGSRPVVVLATLLAAGVISGCTSTVSVRATDYDIHVRLEPETHMLRGQTTMTLRREPAHAIRPGPLTVEFALNRALTIERITGSDTEVKWQSIGSPEGTIKSDNSDASSLLAVYRLVLDTVPEQSAVTFDYSGPLVQDVQAGERPGQIHNFLMAAHVGTEGIYLASDGGWYPSLHHDSNEPAPGELASYRLTAEPVDGMKLVAGASFDAAASAQTGRLVWRSRYPLDGMVLVGGPHQVKERSVDGLRLALHYTQPDDPDARRMIERNTEMFLDAAAGYLERYAPLIGAYPFEQFTIVENFFSSGFAFPEFTLLNRRLFQMGPGALRHGFLDHEMLHAWWGNAIYVDPTDGDWCEALTSYAANHYGYILDGDQPGARRYRRNACNAFSLLGPEEDRPLGTFGRSDGAGRDIGYQKGAMVFHMLARRIGQDNFWAALRKLTADHTGAYADWPTLQALFEQQSGVKLGRFFQEWVRSSGAPCLALCSARWHEDAHALELTLDQGGTAFELAVPLLMVYQEGTPVEEVVAIDERTATIRISLAAPPTSVVLDPDYDVFRRLPPGEAMPTTRTTLAGKQLLVVTPGGDISPFYQTVIDRFTDEKAAADVTQCTVEELATEALTRQSVLILGDAVRSPHVRALLDRTNCPITWHEPGFQIDGETYDQPGHSVLCTVHHPDAAACGITIYCGNSEDALGRSDLLLFYRNSLVVFETITGESAGQKTYESRVVDRRDFESQQSIAVSLIRQNP